MPDKNAKRVFKSLGDVFLPMLPGFVLTGICAGFSSLIVQFVPYYNDNRIWMGIYTILSMIDESFNPFLLAWVGFHCALIYGATPILGGMLGLLSGLEGIETLASIVGFRVLHKGSGGIIAILTGVWFLGWLEKFFRKKLPDIISSIFAPLFSFICCIVPFVFIGMPLFSIVTDFLSRIIGFLVFNEHVSVRLISGFLCAAAFLPSNIIGFQYAFMSIYAMQIAMDGFTTLYPVLAMAGAGQVGTGIAVTMKARKHGNLALASVTSAGLLPGILGIGSVLLYEVTLPHIRTLVSTCIGAGIGGAFILVFKVASAGWGPSGILAIPLMSAGSGGPLLSMLFYCCGLLLSCTTAFLIACFFVPVESLE
ncbi:MAG: PTS transporter subunit EIIC [Sphaerochaeta sp.]